MVSSLLVECIHYSHLVCCCKIQYLYAILINHIQSVSSVYKRQSQPIMYSFTLYFGYMKV